MFKTIRNMGKLISESTEFAASKLEQANLNLSKKVDHIQHAKNVELRKQIQFTDFSNHPDVIAAMKQVDKLVNP